MSSSFPIVGGNADPLRGAAPAPPRPAPEGSFAKRMEAASAVVGAPSEPPPEVRAEVQAAARAADKLHEMGRQLHFDQDKETGRISIEVRDLDGNLLRRVPPSEVFDFAAGRVTG